MRKIINIFLIIILTVSINLCSFAANSVSELNAQINEAEGDLKQVKKEKTQALKELEGVTSQIEDLENQVIELDTKIEVLANEIENKKNDIIQKEKDYEERRTLLDNRLLAVYTTGQMSYLDVLLNSTSISDFISNYYLIEQLADCDSDLLTQIKNLKEQIEKEKKELETNKVELENSKVAIEEKRKSLESVKNEKTTRVKSLNVEERKIQAEIDEFENDKKEILEAAAKAAKEASVSKTSSSGANTSNSSSSSSATISSTSTVSVCGFISPISGRNKADITTGFYGYRNHGGVDFARNSKGAVLGLPVVAAKSGVVVKSLAKKNSSGNYTSYGEYIQINHPDGSSTLYAHMQQNSRKVSVGDHVSQGQVIGNVGQTGNASGPHLHFEIMISGVRMDPSKYLP